MTLRNKSHRGRNGRFSAAYDAQLEVTCDRALPDGTPIASGANARAQSALSYGSEGLARASDFKYLAPTLKDLQEMRIEMQHPVGKHRNNRPSCCFGALNVFLLCQHLALEEAISSCSIEQFRPRRVPFKCSKLVAGRRRGSSKLLGKGCEKTNQDAEDAALLEGDRTGQEAFDRHVRRVEEMSVNIDALSWRLW
jgi:hypothetical protein